MRGTTGDQDLSILQGRFQWITFGVLIAVFSLFPLFAGLRWLDFFIRAGITLISVLGLGLLTGYCGQISLGQAAFMSVGSFTGAIAAQHGMTFLLALLLSGIIAGC